MCDIKYWKDIENLRSVYKKRFLKFWAVSSIFDLFQLSKKSLLRDEHFFSLNKSNGAYKNTSFRPDLKNVHMTLVKKCTQKMFKPKNCFTNWKFGKSKKIGFLGKTFFGCTFY